MNKMFLLCSVLLVASASVFGKTCEIKSADKLQSLGGCGCSDNIVLTGDKDVIDMSGVYFTPLCPSGFSGVFDGGNHIISNLTISQNMVLHKNIAFIAVLKGGVLRNVSFVNPTIEAHNYLLGVSGVSVAIAVGELNGGSVENVHVTSGEVSVSSLLNNATADAGGLVGTADSGAVSESGGDIDVSNMGGRNGTVGGICGNIMGDVTLSSVTYSGNVEEVVGAVSANATLTSKYGAVNISQARSANSAIIEGSYTAADSVKIVSDISVSSVELNRTFEKNTLASIMLPFSISASQISGATKIYKFNRVAKNDEGIWKVKVSSVTELNANTPYMVLPAENGRLSFNLEDHVTFNTTTGPSTRSVVSDDWEFIGVYAYTYFDFDFPDVDRVYGFAGVEGDGYKPGDFVKVGVGADIPAMRAYLIHHRSPMTKAVTKTFNDMILPDLIEIEVEDEHGMVVGTGRLNTVTSETRMDRWYDLKGRRLNSRPSTKGTYYNNGKKLLLSKRRKECKK